MNRNERTGSESQEPQNWTPAREMYKNIANDPKISNLLEAFRIAASSELGLLPPFLVDLISEKELQNLSNRWVVVQRLYQGNSQAQIIRELKMGSSTVYSVAQKIDPETERGFGALFEVASRVSKQDGL